METWGVSLTWGKSCWRVLPGKLMVGGNYLWCLVIVIFMVLGRAKKLGGRGGFKVMIWGRASHKGGTNFYGGELTPLDTTRKIGKCNIIFCILSISHHIFIMTINKLIKSLKVSNLTKNLRNWSQTVTSNTKNLFQWQIGNLISFWELHHFENILFKRTT